MTKSDTITKIAPALLKAQQEMGAAKKTASNPFFTSSYADLNAIREAVLPALNANNITVLQPTVVENGKNYVQTVLLHESGEFLASLTEIKAKDANDPQKEGSGISYARRYGLQSFLNVAAEDDDANAASGKNSETKTNNVKKASFRKTGTTGATSSPLSSLGENGDDSEWGNN
jgi:hypothetical protein